MSEGSLQLPHPQTHPQAGTGLDAARNDARRSARAARIGSLTASQALVGVCLGLILLCGGAFRFVGLDWDEGQHLHPDERFLTMVETALQWPQGSLLESYFDEAKSTLNPRNVGHGFFVYGSFPILIVKVVSMAANKTGYDQVHLVGRAVDGLVDLGTVGMLFLLARTLYRDTRVALLAALLYSATALAIQQAHFFVVESFTAFFVTVALFFMARASITDGFRIMPSGGRSTGWRWPARSRSTRLSW
jgi:hypothetical protein